MLFNSAKYAIFFAIAFVGSWSLARGESRFVRGAFFAALAAYVARQIYLGWPHGNHLDLALALGFAMAWTFGRASWDLARILFLLVLSYYFYASWNWRYLPLIFGSSTVDFFLAHAIAREDRASRRRAMLVVTVALNLGFLGFFKYWNFGVENVRLLVSAIHGTPMGATSDTLRVLLPPVGISFFTFESMSYVIDVYRRELPPYKSYVRYLLFVSFFPHLVAGPIVRPRDLLPQLERPAALTREMGGEALFLIGLGLLKKIVISDQLSSNLVDRVFQRPENFSSLEVLAAVYGYAVQIYCDFSGYSDIAIGSALLLGVRFPKNFDAPYQSANLADFWRRWHISLSSWLRDYLYIPLGGSRGSEWKTYRNLLITMVLGGLWHGASWTFAVWGLLHGVGLAVTRVVQRRRRARAALEQARLFAARDGARPYRAPATPPEPPRESQSADEPWTWGRVVSVMLTFHYVCFAWIFFRADTFARARLILRQLVMGTTFHPNLPAIVLGALGIGLVAQFTPRHVIDGARRGFTSLPAPAQGALLFGVAVVLHEVSSAVAVPFVYFQF